MSLDVYLEIENPVTRPVTSGIFIRENGQTKEITREGWDAAHPGREPVVLQQEPKTCEVFSANITHNLNAMAKEAGIYSHLWRPDEIGITKAEELIAPLLMGRDLLLSDPERFRAFNPENGWGDYEGLVAFVSNYVNACIASPGATVKTWR